MVYTASTIYYILTNGLSIIYAGLYCRPKCSVNLLLLLIPDHLVGKEAFLLGEIMMSLFAEVAAKSLVWKQQILLSLMDCFLSKH